MAKSHYFAVCPFGWSANEDPQIAVESLPCRDFDGFRSPKYALFEVLAESTACYNIQMFMPLGIAFTILYDGLSVLSYTDDNDVKQSSIGHTVLVNERTLDISVVN